MEGSHHITILIHLSVCPSVQVPKPRSWNRGPKPGFRTSMDRTTFYFFFSFSFFFFFFSPFSDGLAFFGVVSKETRSSVRLWRLFFFFFALFQWAGLFWRSFYRNEVQCPSVTCRMRKPLYGSCLQLSRSYSGYSFLKKYIYDEFSKTMRGRLTVTEGRGYPLVYI
jgi:hypothetical protein